MKLHVDLSLGWGTTVIILFLLALLKTGAIPLIMAFVGGIIGVIVFVMMLSDPEELMPEDPEHRIQRKILGSLVILVVVINAFLCLTYTTITPTKDVYAQGEPYYMTAPFGILWVETSGHFSGFIGVSGRIASSLSESYVVKYMVGDEMKTVICPVDRTTLLVDGKWSFEYGLAYSLTSNPFYGKLWTDMLVVHQGESLLDLHGYYILHIPAKPDLGDSTSTQYYQVRP